MLDADVARDPRRLSRIAASNARAVVLTGANGDFSSGADVVTSSGSEGFEGSKLTAMRLLAESVLRSPADVPTMATGKVDKPGLQALLRIAGERAPSRPG